MQFLLSVVTCLGTYQLNSSHCYRSDTMRINHTLTSVNDEVHCYKLLIFAGDDHILSLNSIQQIDGKVCIMPDNVVGCVFLDDCRHGVKEAGYDVYIPR